MRGLLAAVLTVCAIGSAWAERVQQIAAAKPAPGGERRIALVIGNSAYKTSPLRNPVNDARAIAGALGEAGFAVQLLQDGTLAGMRRAVRDFGNEIARGGVGLFYYAGHGMQVRGRNYLIPVNADIQSEDEIEDQGVDTAFVMSKMDTAKNTLNILILDACRNNPFQRSFRSAAQGLAQMDAPTGTLISFATAPGSVAADGEGENGIYTKHLLSAIRQPGLPIEQLFKQVRIGVTKDTGDKQVPWESSSLRGDFFFLPPAPGTRLSKADVDKTVGDAMRTEQERSARERVELQARMEQMIQDALAKQRAMLEAERKGQAAAIPATALAPAIAPAASPLPTVPAQAARPATAASLPTSGSRWQYAGFDSDRRENAFEYLVEAQGATAAGVLETTRTRTGAAQWVHTNTPTVVGIGPGLAAFSPLVVAGAKLEPGQRWADIAVVGIGSCGRGFVTCFARGQVEGREQVSVKGGTFDALKVAVAVVIREHYSGADIELTWWYSEAAQRPVRYEKRVYVRGPGPHITEPNADLELVGYQLQGKGPVGTIDPALAAQR